MIHDLHLTSSLFFTGGSVLNKKPPSVAEMSKLEAQINSLHRQLDFARKDRFTKIPPKDTIRSIINGEPYSLELYKSKADKLELLDQAIHSHDGNAITAVLLFLKSTVKNSIFSSALMARPIAVNHYISFLKQHFDYNELIDFLGMLGRTEEAAMIKYKQAVIVKNAETKARNLETCYRTHFATDPLLAHDAQLIQDQVSLIKELQIPVEDADVKAMHAGDLRYKG